DAARGRSIRDDPGVRLRPASVHGPVNAMPDLLFRPVAELASLIRTGELTARELVETSLRRIDELDPTINAFTHVAHDSALSAADEIKPGDSRPFAGV